MKINRESAEHYIWKEQCDGWHFLKSDDLSIIAEKMPPGATEDMHAHNFSRQFFYILRGQAKMVFTDNSEVLNEGEGIEIKPTVFHQMTNPYESEVEFIVVSSPKSHGDKILI